MNRITRRQAIGGLAGSIAGLTVLPRFASSQSLPLPASPVALNIIDVAGNLQLTQAAIEKFARENTQLISKVIFSRAPSPELPGKLKGQV